MPIVGSGTLCADEGWTASFSIFRRMTTFTVGTILVNAISYASAPFRHC